MSALSYPLIVGHLLTGMRIAMFCFANAMLFSYKAERDRKRITRVRYVKHYQFVAHWSYRLGVGAIFGNAFALAVFQVVAWVSP